MGISVSDNIVKVDEEEMDIYVAMELKSALDGIYSKGINEIILDLSRVSSLSTPAVQTLLSAVKTLKKVDIDRGSLTPSMQEDLRCLGVSL